MKKDVVNISVFALHCTDYSQALRAGPTSACGRTLHGVEAHQRVAKPVRGQIVCATKTDTPGMDQPRHEGVESLYRCPNVRWAHEEERGRREPRSDGAWSISEDERSVVRPPLQSANWSDGCMPSHGDSAHHQDRRRPFKKDPAWVKCKHDRRGLSMTRSAARGPQKKCTAGCSAG